MVGASDAKGETIKDRPIYPWDLTASIYKLLGIDYLGKLPHPQGCGVASLSPLAGGGVKSGGSLDGDHVGRLERRRPVLREMIARMSMHTRSFDLLRALVVPAVLASPLCGPSLADAQPPPARHQVYLSGRRAKGKVRGRDR